MSTRTWIVIVVAIILLIVLVTLFAREKSKNKKSATVQSKHAPDNKIVVITRPQTIKAGSVSPKMTIQIQDLKGNPAEAVSSTVVNLSSSSSSGIFSANGNDPAIKSITVFAGTNSANFYYKDPTKGNPDIIASNDGLAPGTQTEIIN